MLCDRLDDWTIRDGQLFARWSSPLKKTMQWIGIGHVLPGSGSQDPYKIDQIDQMTFFTEGFTKPIESDLFYDSFMIRNDNV